MLYETSIPGTDDWWVMQLAEEFGRDLPRLYKLQSYVDGTNALPDEWDTAMRDAYRRFIHMSRLNMAELIVSARVDRMKPLGFRTAAPGDANGDKLAMATWKRSTMKVGVRDFFADAGTFGKAYLTTTGPQRPSADAQPLIIRSSGMSTISRQSAIRPDYAEAAVTVGHDPINQVDILTLFRPGVAGQSAYMRQAYRQARVSAIPTNGSSWYPGRGWTWVSDPVLLGYTAEVPVFQMRGRNGKGMFEKHLDSLDRISNGIRERLTINAMQAFKQRAIKAKDAGSLPDVYPAGHELAGQRVPYDDIFKAGPAALWKLPPGVDIWESAVADTTGILQGSKDDIRNLAATSSTSLYILSPDSVNGSAGGADLAREAQTFSTEDWIDRAEIPLAQSLSAAFMAQGDTVRATIGEITTIWAPVDRISIESRAQSASQAKGGGLSQQLINEKIWQLTPDEIELEKQYKADELFEQAAAGGV
jgi:hypothetical protein